MGILTWFVIIPVLTITGIVLVKDVKQTKLVAAVGMGIQLILSAVLIFLYLAERNAGNTAEMLFVQNYEWFKSLHIAYAVGVDGISVAMIGLTSICRDLCIVGS
jgi:NADH-quinone oxidoreductase subunit M